MRLRGLPVGRLRRSRAGESAARLRARLARDGYLYLPALLPARLSLAARAEALSLGPEAARLWVGRPAYDRLCGAAAVRGLLSRVLGPIAAHPWPAARAGRAVPPSGKARAGSPPHQDLPYFKAPEETYTVWLPAGDCPAALGGLAVMPGSQLLGPLAHAVGRALRRLPRGPGRRWLTAAYRAGDAVVFHSCTIHASLPNRSGNAWRFSADVRYCPKAALKEDPRLLAALSLAAGASSPSLERRSRR